MEIRLDVIEGKDKGKSFVFNEPDCFIVGRDAAGSMAHYKLGAEDRFVSRNHFILEIRPPRCYVRDNGSKNGTYVKKRGSPDFQMVPETELHDGDIIKVGLTLMLLTIPILQRKTCTRCGMTIDSGEMCIGCIDDLRKVAEKQMPKCQRCGAVMPGGDGTVCGKCLEKEKKTISKLIIPRPAVKKFYCIKCGKDVTSAAMADGRAEELDGVASYFCRNCAAGDEREVDIQEIKEYRILRVLGRGGMGVVYKAYHKPTGRLVALKKIIPEASLSKKANYLFKREIDVMRELKHQNIVRLYDDGRFGNDLFFTSEFLLEGDADRLVTHTYSGPVPPPTACDIIMQALDGLSYAHDKGYIHRDIKPQNILLNAMEGGRYRAKIADFGLSKIREGMGASSFTQLGEYNGTPFFMAPEQLLEYKNVKPAADIFSVGVSLYYMLTSKYQYHFPSPGEMFKGLLKGQRPKDPFFIMIEEEPIPIRQHNPDIPAPLAEVVDIAVRKDKNKRYQTAEELKDAIRQAMK